MAKKEYRQHCDSYTLHFNDDGEGVVWTTGNLQRFLRNLYHANPILRQLNHGISAKEFAKSVADRSMSVMCQMGRSVANFYLVPRSAGVGARELYSGTISRNVMKSAKVID
jgi:hypothetical protein